jgi:5'-nucleotidase
MIRGAKWYLSIGMVAAAAVGCQSNNDTAPRSTASSSGVRNDVTDIRPMESNTPTYQATYQPAQAATPATPIATDTTATATPAATSTTAGNTHVVKHGETLYSIAKASYGDGKQWQKIASANPGVSPSSLKVGQTLVIP